MQEARIRARDGTGNRGGRHGNRYGRGFADEGINYQRAMHATCMDADATAVHITYVQLSLLHIPAIVVHGKAFRIQRLVNDHP